MFSLIGGDFPTLTPLSFDAARMVAPGYYAAIEQVARETACVWVRTIRVRAVAPNNAAGVAWLWDEAMPALAAVEGVELVEFEDWTQTESQLGGEQPQWASLHTVVEMGVEL